MKRDRKAVSEATEKDLVRLCEGTEEWRDHGASKRDEIFEGWSKIIILEMRRAIFNWTRNLMGNE